MTTIFWDDHTSASVCWLLCRWRFLLVVIIAIMERQGRMCPPQIQPLTQHRPLCTAHLDRVLLEEQDGLQHNNVLYSITLHCLDVR